MLDAPAGSEAMASESDSFSADNVLVSRSKVVLLAAGVRVNESYVVDSVTAVLNGARRVLIRPAECVVTGLLCTISVPPQRMKFCRPAISAIVKLDARSFPNLGINT